VLPVLEGDHPPSNPIAYNVLQRWKRSANAYVNQPVGANGARVCVVGGQTAACTFPSDALTAYICSPPDVRNLHERVHLPKGCEETCELTSSEEGHHKGLLALTAHIAATRVLRVTCGLLVWG